MNIGKTPTLGDIEHYISRAYFILWSSLRGIKVAYLQLSTGSNKNKNQVLEDNIKIAIFTEGTILKPLSMFRHFNHATYIPIKNSVDIIRSWEEQGAEILYFTSRKKLKQVQEIKKILLGHKFMGTCLYYRNEKQKYSDLVEEVMPDVIIEDNCRSIGGKWQMCNTYLRPEIKNKVKSIVVSEFKGIEHLPLVLSELLA